MSHKEPKKSSFSMTKHDTVRLVSVFCYVYAALCYALHGQLVISGVITHKHTNTPSQSQHCTIQYEFDKLDIINKVLCSVVDSL